MANDYQSLKGAFEPETEITIDTARQLHGEAQSRARHYELLMGNANVLIISAAMIFLGLAMGDHLTAIQSRLPNLDRPQVLIGLDSLGWPFAPSFA